ncbi:pectate lyase [Halosimplex amylolyticum]|uniref:pectate lyase n=1 Tax=Halosimplex amylolyticum TaxID=3396616 RepID=UPI003F55607C
MEKDRRTFLRAIGLGTAGGLAGCSALSGDGTPGSTETPADGSTDAPTETPTDADTATATATGTPEPTEQAPEAAGGKTLVTVKGGGEDIWDSNDFGHFYYETLTGDFDVRTEVVSVQNTDTYAKAGLMARASLDSGSRNVFMRKRPGDLPVSPQWRPEDGTASASVTSDAGKDLARNGGVFEGTWQRIERVGDTIRTYGSADGENWTLLLELGPNTIELPDEVLVGLAVTSHDRASVCAARFRNLDGFTPDQNSDIGGPIMSGEVSVVEDVPVVEAGDVSDTSATEATLAGNVTSLGAADSAELTFEYREIPDQEWSEAGATTASSTGETTVTASALTPRRYYEYRVTIDNGEASTTSPHGLFSTAGPGSGDGSDGPRSASAVDPSDGFTELAPWLDDDTPLIVIDEPSAAKLKTALNINGPRVVTFATSGTIDLDATHLAIPYDECWIAGQTAPSPGITLVRGGLQINGDDCVVQHLHVRPGDAGLDREWQNDPIRTGDGTENNVVDHCSTTWSTDENLSVGYDTDGTTVTNCLVAEPLHDSLHPKGPHGYNSLIGNNAKNVTLAGNVWAFVKDRNPRLKQGTETAVVNNFVHHHSDGMWADPETKHSIVGNVFEEPQSEKANVFGEGEVYAEDNVQNDDADVSMIGSGITRLESRPLFPSGLESFASGETKAHNLKHAGARPADRTEHDERIVANIRNGEGGVIDSQDDVGGYPDLPENTHEISVPDTGLRTWLRERAVAVEP